MKSLEIKNENTKTKIIEFINTWDWLVNKNQGGGWKEFDNGQDYLEVGRGLNWDLKCSQCQEEYHYIYKVAKKNSEEIIEVCINCYEKERLPRTSLKEHLEVVIREFENGKLAVCQECGYFNLSCGTGCKYHVYQGYCEKHR